MPARSEAGTLSVPMSKPRYTAVESQLTISPLNSAASARASALLPVAVGPRTAATNRSATQPEHDVHEKSGEEEEKTALLGPGQHWAASTSASQVRLKPDPTLVGRALIVIERHGEKGLLHRILRGQRQRWIRRDDGSSRRCVEALHA